MFPTLHSAIRDVLASNETLKVQFILEPLALPQIATSHELNCHKFIEQVSYLTRTFAFYIHREYQKVVKLAKNNPHPIAPIPIIICNNILTNPVFIPANPGSSSSPCRPSADSTSQQSYQPVVQHDNGCQQCPTSLYLLPSTFVHTCPSFVSSTMPSTVQISTHSSNTPARTDVADVQGSNSDSTVRPVSHYQYHTSGHVIGWNIVGLVHSSHHHLILVLTIIHALVHSSVEMYQCRRSIACQCP
jgi:hypothetical protein